MKILKILLISILSIFILNKTSQAQYRSLFPDEGHYISPGFNLGFTLYPNIIAGAELSYFYLYDAIIGGAVFNISYDHELKTATTMIGPEFGFFLLGFDGGILIRVDKNTSKIGFSIRPFLTIPLNNRNIIPSIILYYRYNYFSNKTNYSEIGFLFKIPICIN